jgi:FR47-like protein
MTADVGEFLVLAGEFLRAEPARNSVMLTVTSPRPGTEFPSSMPSSRRPTRSRRCGGSAPGTRSPCTAGCACSGWRGSCRPRRVPRAAPGRAPGPTGTCWPGCRVAPPVYTPPALRGHGYAAGVTAAVSQAALDAGVEEVVLYTDLANPVSNALYERLGYRAVEDRVLLSFEPPVTLHP